MLQINILSVQALKEKQFVAYMMFVKKAVENHEVVQQWFPFFVNKFMDAYEALDEAFIKYDVDRCTRAVHDANDKRDLAFRKMRDTIKMFITYPETDAKTQAAEELLRVIDLYGGIYIPSQGLTAKTASISNLVDDFEKNHTAEIALLGVGAEVAALKAAQQLFDDKYMARDVCESELAKGAMAEARRNSTEAYRLLVDAVNVKAYEDSEGQLDAFIKLLNVEIGKNRTYTGQGQVGSTSGSGSDEDEGGEALRIKTATFTFKNGDQVKLKVEVGSVLIAPSNTEGYRWKPEVPELMPSTNKTFTEVPIDEEEVTATFHFFDHREEEIKQVVGSALVAPENTAGYYWEPEVPSVMPAENTSYYEMPEEQSEQFTALFTFHGGRTEEITAEAGAALTAPTNTEGYMWQPAVPAVMPAEDTSYTEVEDNRQEYQITYMDANNEDEFDIQMVKEGDPIVPPTPPTGYHWVDVPEVMPARNIYIRCAANA